MSRITKEEIFMKSAVLWSKRGTCMRKQVGAVIVFDNRIISSGYVGSPPGEPHCLDVGCLVANGGCIRTVHAERNAIDFARKLFNVDAIISNSVMYTTMSPCLDCAKYIVENNIMKVVYLEEYRDMTPVHYLYKNGVKVIPYQEIVKTDQYRISECQPENSLSGTSVKK
jgi:dCMP deaminase